MYELAIPVGSTATTIFGVYFMLKFIIIPKLNAVCIRTARMEVAQANIIDHIEVTDKVDLRHKINEEIQMLGIPTHLPPIKQI